MFKNYLPPFKFLLTIIISFVACSFANGQTSAFTYQGRLNDNNVAPTRSYIFELRLFDATTNGNQLGSAVSLSNVQVVSGIFTVELDFGATAFAAGADRFIEIAVKRDAPDAFTVLTPRQRLTVAPYALRAVTTATADNSLNLGGVAAASYVQTNDARLTDDRNPLAGSNNYIQNSSVQQANTNLSISGDAELGGTLSANTIDAASQYQIAGSRILGNSGTDNLFAGIGAGTNNTGSGNAFFGKNAGLANTSGVFNSFLGKSAGAANTTGSDNAFLGTHAGEVNSSGNYNSFFGSAAGRANTTGNLNSFFGFLAGRENTTASLNSFFGNYSGRYNTTGTENAFFGGNTGRANTTGSFNSILGRAAGSANTTGNYNSFLGFLAGKTNTTGSFNTAVGANADVGSDNLSFATAIGAGATVSTNNTLVLGRNADTVLAPGDLNVSGTGTANVLNAVTQYDLNGARIMSAGGTDNFFAGTQTGPVTTGGFNAFVGFRAGTVNTTGESNSFFGSYAGTRNTTGGYNSFFGMSAGTNNTTGYYNSFFGRSTGVNNTIGSDNSFFGRSAGVLNVDGNYNTFIGMNAGGANVSGNRNTTLGHDANVASGSLSYATAIGSQAVVSTSNTIVLGRASGQETVLVPGLLQINTLGSAGSTQLCQNAVNEISTCSSSLRYKTNILPYASGLQLINQLRPITFDWKDNAKSDLGLGAEDVAAVEPLLVTKNSKGETEGVKYDRVAVVLVNAVKEQQLQIEQQQLQIEKQKQLIKALQQLVCANNKEAAVCVAAEPEKQ